MAELTWFDELGPVDDAVIHGIERALGVIFPDDYRAFSRRHQGGYPMQTDFRLSDPRKSVVAVGRFLSMVPESGPSFIVEAQRLHSDQLPEGVILVAEGPGGDYVALDYRSTHGAEVVYWHHERAGEPDEFTPVSKTFASFLDLLYEPDVEAESELDDSTAPVLPRPGPR